MKGIVIFIMVLSCVIARGGTITWRSNQSPVVLTNNFEVPPNDTLVIEAGVVVVSDQQSTRRYIIPYDNSAIRVNGSQTNPAVFISVGIDATVAGNQVFAQNLIMTNGWIQTWGNALRFEADQCTFQKTEINSRGLTNIITHSVFVGSWFSDLSNTLLQNNVFLGWPSERTLMLWPANSTIRLNSFLDLNLVVIRCGDFNISQNYWGTTNISTVEARIIDRNDTFSISGYATFQPILTSPHSDTPSGPTLPAPLNPPILSIRKSVQLEFQSEPLVFYRIEGSDDATTWATVSEQILGTGASIRWFCPADLQRRYYRVQASR